jgi:hypothetical protein
MVGLEDEQTVFARYQAIRRAERDYLPEAAEAARPPWLGSVSHKPVC